MRKVGNRHWLAMMETLQIVGHVEHYARTRARVPLRILHQSAQFYTYARMRARSDLL